MAAAAAAYAFWPPHLPPNTLLASPASSAAHGLEVALLAAWVVALLAAWEVVGLLLEAVCGLAFCLGGALGGVLGCCMQWPPWVVWQAAAWLLTSLVLAMPVLVEDLLCACS